MAPDRSACRQCSATGCKEKYGEMLALEFEQPSVFGAVHHLTVICYNIQHPDAFTDEALAWMRTSLRDIVEKGLSGPELLKRAQGPFSGDFKVKRRDARARDRPDAVPYMPVRTRWSMTVADVCTASPEVYTGDIKAWAKSILKDLGEK
jgi:Family of unknown function (DUF5946)